MPPPVFFTAPHRVMFASGVIQLLLAFVLWSIELGMRAGGGGATLFPQLPSALWHPLLMSFAFFPFFIFGFLMTALPKWVGARALTSVQYLPAFALMAGGWVLFYVAALAGSGGAAGGGLIVVALGWGLGGVALAQAAGVDNPDKRHAWAAISFVFFGALTLAVGGAVLVAGRPALLRSVTMLGLWGFIVPVFVVVIHRMLPFFSQGTIPGAPFRPMWMLWLLLACLAIHGVLAAGALAPVLAAPSDALAAALALTLTWRWQIARSFANRLLATHHVAFVWLGLALAAFAAQGVLGALGIDGGGNAPMHALTAGFLLSMALGMAQRVTYGHSGLSIVAPGWMWSAFWVLQAAIALRLFAEFAPLAWRPAVLLVSALLMLAVFGVWGGRNLGHFFRPRADGQPG